MNIFIQRILQQLHSLYEHHAIGTSITFGDYSDLYDALIRTGHKIDVEDKKELWKLAVKTMNKKAPKMLSDGWTKEQLKPLLEKKYKSLLAYKYVVSKLPETLDFYDEYDVKLKRMDVV